jgi:hypothetical protein
MRNFGHARTQIERPDSVNDPLGDSQKLTAFERFVLAIGIVGGGYFGVMVAHGYYVWFLR